MALQENIAESYRTRNAEELNRLNAEIEYHLLAAEVKMRKRDEILGTLDLNYGRSELPGDVENHITLMTDLEAA